ncbi:MAG: glucuronate isomerase [Erysipelotrichaceae bacterium]|nr:glucuronate isomerase [Erysipelotrichaceae bacterium]
MSNFMSENYLLESPLAVRLYNDYCKGLPIVDYHCHLSPKEIAEDKHFENITRLWLCENNFGDHYKWRMMRGCGVPEKYITGDGDDKEKFHYWAKTLERSIGNPVYSFTHLELQRYFGIYEPLCEKTWEAIWEKCNEKLKDPKFSTKNLIMDSNVTLVCTTDDPADSLEYHKIIKEDKNFTTKVLPAYRPDKAMNITDPNWKSYIKTLEAAAGMTINSYATLIEALKKRVAFFNEMGCRASDHALVTVKALKATPEELEAIIAKRFNDEPITDDENTKFICAFLKEHAKEYVKYGWGMQLHYGAIRNVNSNMYGKLGPDTGYDAINSLSSTSTVAAFLDLLNEEDILPKTIIYSLNPVDNAAIVTQMSAFQKDVQGKIQQGSAWWFNDHKKGIIDQMTTLASDGILGNFVGMLTDSRSFLSYPRHEYFRRIMVNLIADYVNKGEYPEDEDALKMLIHDISYNNVVGYFNFPVEKV